MDSGDYGTLCNLPGLGIIWNESGYHEYHIGDMRCMEFQNICECSIHIFHHLISDVINRCTSTFCTEWILSLCTLTVYIQSAINSINTLCALSHSSGSLMNCNSCSWE